MGNVAKAVVAVLTFGFGCSSDTTAELTPSDFAQYFFYEKDELEQDAKYGYITIEADGKTTYRFCELKPVTFSLSKQDVSSLFSDLVSLGIFEVEVVGAAGYTGSPRPGFDVQIHGRKKRTFVPRNEELPKPIRDRFKSVLRKVDPEHWAK